MRTIKVFIWLLMIFFVVGCSTKPASQTANKNLLMDILGRHPDKFGAILENADLYRLQIIYTQVNRGSENKPHFTTYSFRERPREYYYPASTIKLPGAALALEKLNDLNITGLNRDTWLMIDSSFSGQSAVDADRTSESSLPSIGHYVHKAVSVSDNDAYNRLYEFLGQDHINRRLWELGSESARFRHRLSIALSIDENRHTNPFVFYNELGVVHYQPEQIGTLDYDLPADDYHLGIGELQGEEVVPGPKDFRHKNYITLADYHTFLIRLMFPESAPENQHLNLSDEDYRFLYRSMSILPRESKYPTFDAGHYWDSYVKFFMFGASDEPIPEHIRIFNKVGLAYGFLIDHAYIVDFKNGVEFFLSAVIWVNDNQILNDGIYEYDEVGLPFMQELGQAVYRYELDRQREFIPDLTRFKLEY